MVAKGQIKLIRSLHQKKYRNQNGLFVVEGIKGVNEVLRSRIKPYAVYGVNADLLDDDTIFTRVSERELAQMSALKSPNGILGVFHVPEEKEINFSDWVLVLDDVRDPGNLGTIIRLCDWFGIAHLVCSQKTVDCYNPKVLQATMGSITRVNIVYRNIADFLDQCPTPIYGAFMNGVSAYSEELPQNGILIMGNEAHGISKEIEQLVSKKISIPQFGKHTTESLNVATATAILLNEIRR